MVHYHSQDTDTAVVKMQNISVLQESLMLAPCYSHSHFPHISNPSLINGNHVPIFHFTVLSFQDNCINQVIQYTIFWDWLFSLSIMSSDAPRLLCVTAVLSFLFFLVLNSIPWYGGTTVCVTMHWLMDIWIDSRSWLL